MARVPAHPWAFRARFRRHAFGWKSQPAIARVKEAVAEIKKVARTDELLAAEGAVHFLEKLSPAIERVDSSSGAIGTAVNRAIDVLVAIIARAPADVAMRERWRRSTRINRKRRSSPTSSTPTLAKKANGSRRPSRPSSSTKRSHWRTGRPAPRRP